MRKYNILVLFGIAINLLGCNLRISSSSLISQEISTSSIVSSSSTTLSNASSSSISNSSSVVNSSSSSSETTINLYSIYIDNFTYSEIGAYETGNYETTFVDIYEFAHYRVSEPNSSSYAMKLLPYVSHVDDNSLPGMLYNIDPILGIKEIIMTYNTDSSSLNPILRYGSDKSILNQLEIPASMNENTVSFKLNNTNYFRVETNDAILNIKEIEIKYTNENTVPYYEYLSSGEDNFRLNPTRFVGELVSGESSVNVPISVDRIGDDYIVNQFKNYTYYSYEHIVNNPSLADEASYTTPEDVSAYYIAFGTWPANYVKKNNYSAAYQIFGDNTRCVSTYTRTDGYAQFVPWESMPNDNKPRYHELDIALNNYSNKSRGVGRVVVWEYGFDAEGYDNSPVAVYTDDHYATFQEYLNTGVFGTRFNAEMSPTNYRWGSPSILTI